MKQDALAKWLKFIIAGVGICGLLTYTVIMPNQRDSLLRSSCPGMEDRGQHPDGQIIFL